MNRITIIAAAAASILLLPTPRATAQKVDIALTGGVNVANFSVSDSEFAFESIRRGTLGVSARVGLIRHLGIELNGDFSQKGGLAQTEQGGLKLHMSYFELTAMARAILPLAKDRIRPYLAAGPAWSWARRSACNLKSAVPQGGWDVRSCGLEDYRDRNFGIAGAAGLELQLSQSMGFTVRAVRNLGLTNTVQSEEVGSMIGELKHRTTSFRGGFVFRVW